MGLYNNDLLKSNIQIISIAIIKIKNMKGNYRKYVNYI